MYDDKLEVVVDFFYLFLVIYDDKQYNVYLSSLLIVKNRRKKTRYIIRLYTYGIWYAITIVISYVYLCSANLTLS